MRRLSSARVRRTSNRWTIRHLVPWPNWMLRVQCIPIGDAMVIVPHPPEDSLDGVLARDLTWDDLAVDAARRVGDATNATAPCSTLVADTEWEFQIARARDEVRILARLDARFDQIRRASLDRATPGQLIEWHSRLGSRTPAMAARLAAGRVRARGRHAAWLDFSVEQR